MLRRCDKLALEVIRITRKNSPRYEAGVSRLEQFMTYPLGEDTFRLDHGNNYFAFFERLGDVHFYAVRDTSSDTIAAVACGILREVPERPGSETSPAWYLCDLKIHPDYRGRGLHLKMMKTAFTDNYDQCPRVYTISMNKPGRNKNGVIWLLKRFRWAPLSFAGNLEIYSFDFDQITRYRNLLQEHLGPVSFLSLKGKKDLILGSTGQRMPLLHVQYGPCAEPALAQPQPDHAHMFCTPENSALTLELKHHNLIPTASASIAHHKMPHADWQFILTSDI